MIKRIFAIGDIHGRVEALKEVLEKSKFSYANDKLIVLGDIADGGYNTYECVEELLKIKNIVYIFGNHDCWLLKNIRMGWAEEIWIQQGGANTLRSYGAKVKEAERVSDESYIDTRKLNIPVTHQDFFNRGKYWHTENNMLFVHAGINPKIPRLESQSKHDLVWDRNLIEYAKRHKVQSWDKVFIGHTTTQGINNTMKPVIYNNLYCIDCGAGWSGKLCLYNVKTDEYWLSQTQLPAINQNI